MRIVADLSKLRRICILSLLMITGVTAAAQFGQVQGQVVDTKGYGIAGVSVYLIDSQGRIITAVTDQNGLYNFQNVKPGPHLMQIKPPAGFTVIDPPNGVVEVQVIRDQTVTQVWTCRGGGVIIDFGDPPTNGSGTQGKMFDPDLGLLKPLLLNLRGVQDHFGEKPMAIQWTGHIRVPGDEKVQVQVAKAFLSQTYPFGSIQVESLGKNRFSLTMKATGWPGFAYDGELAVLYLKVPSALGFEGELSIHTERLELRSASGAPMDKVPFQQAIEK